MGGAGNSGVCFLRGAGRPESPPLWLCLLHSPLPAVLGRMTKGLLHPVTKSQCLRVSLWEAVFLDPTTVLPSVALPPPYTWPAIS